MAYFERLISMAAPAPKSLERLLEPAAEKASHPPRERGLPNRAPADFSLKKAEGRMEVSIKEPPPLTISASPVSRMIPDRRSLAEEISDEIMLDARRYGVPLED